MQKFSGWWDMTHVGMLWELNAFGRTVHIKTGRNSMTFKMMLCFSLAMNLWSGLSFSVFFFFSLSPFLLLFYIYFFHLWFLFCSIFSYFLCFCFVFFFNILFFFLLFFFSLWLAHPSFIVELCFVLKSVELLTPNHAYCPPVHYAFSMVCSSFSSPSNMTGTVVQIQFCLSL